MYHLEYYFRIPIPEVRRDVHAHKIYFCYHSVLTIKIIPTLMLLLLELKLLQAFGTSLIVQNQATLSSGDKPLCPPPCKGLWNERHPTCSSPRPPDTTNYMPAPQYICGNFNIVIAKTWMRLHPSMTSLCWARVNPYTGILREHGINYRCIGLTECVLSGYAQNISRFDRKLNLT